MRLATRGRVGGVGTEKLKSWQAYPMRRLRSPEVWDAPTYGAAKFWASLAAASSCSLIAFCRKFSKVVCAVAK